MSLNDDQKDNARSLAKIPAEEKCDCGWYRVDECHCDEANKYARARQQWLRFHLELNEALDEIRQLRQAAKELLECIDDDDWFTVYEKSKALQSVLDTGDSDSQRSEGQQK